MKRTSIRKFIRELEKWWNPYLPIVYALSLELLELSLFAFAALVTVEAILPGFISFRMNLTKPLLLIILFAAGTIALGHRLGATFPFAPDKKSPLTWIGISWLAFLLTLSAIRFPFWAVPIIVGSFFGIAYLFWKIFFRKG